MKVTKNVTKSQNKIANMKQEMYAKMKDQPNAKMFPSKNAKMSISLFPNKSKERNVIKELSNL